MAKLLTGMLLAALLVAGCSNSGISTGSILGVSSPKAPAAEDPTTRAINVAATSAKAVRCGFNFDPERLKASYLASETGRGLPADQLPRLTQSYDFSFQSVSKSIPNASAYCSDDVAREIKSDLSRNLAGDFSVPASRIVATAPPTGPKVEPMDTGRIFDPTGVRGPRP